MMDDITRRVSEMYAKFPYPSPQAQGRKLKELVNLLKIFGVETGYDWNGKSVLDAGTGTGHRLIEAAKAFKNARFTAVDISETPLAIARQTAVHEGVQNVEFHLANLMDGDNPFGTFDVILSMGVIHHLSDPAAGVRNLVRSLADDGILFLYIYGRHGGRERMRRKQIVSLLLDGNRQNFEQGISLVKALGFDSFEYGWNLHFDDEASRNALIVDAYLNVNERLFDADGIFDLMRTSGLHGFLVYGLTLDTSGRLFDTRLEKGTSGMLMTTDFSAHLRQPLVREAYERLSLADKYRLADLLFQPNGYTLMGFKAGALARFSSEGRILANALTVASI
jgi:SAM-dependent methyltransferase